MIGTDEQNYKVAVNDNSDTRKNNILNIISTTIILGFAISMLYHFIMGVYGGKGYPLNTFLFSPADKFNDFFHPYNQTKDLDPYYCKYLFNSNYYPFAHILIYPLTLLKPIAAFVVYNILVYGIITYIVAIFVKTENTVDYIRYIFSFSLLTYPILFTIDRGNIESVMFIFMYLFVYYFDKNKYTSSLALSAAISIKAFPAAFLSLLLSSKKYKSIILTILFSGLLTIISMFFLKGGIIKNAEFFLNHVSNMNGSVMIQANALVQRGVSLYTIIKIVLIKTGLIYRADINQLVRLYSMAAIVSFIALSYFIFKYKVKMWEKVFLLVAVMLLFPHFSADYKLLHLYIPLALFINESENDRYDTLYAILFAILLIPKDYYLFKGVVSDSGRTDISIAVIINIGILIFVSLSIIGRALQSNRRAC